MVTKERRLGRGLDLLVGGDLPEAEAVATSESYKTPSSLIDISLVSPNRYQPREQFEEEELKVLSDSIKSNGLLQPIVVRRSESGFEIIAGERRWRASKISGMKEIPAIILDKEQEDLLQLALVENIQRKDLNPIEKARGFKALIEKLGLTQEEASSTLGLNRSTIANFIRLLDLPPLVIDAVSRGTISMGHARALLGTTNQSLQHGILKRIIDEDLNVRDVEALISQKTAEPMKSAEARSPNAYIIDLQDRISTHLGTKVIIRQGKKGGKVVIEYYSNEQFNALLRKMNFTP